ncbi:MAG: hypothetical protein E7G37_00730 [Streptococcus sp.]|nr:hypothetical protein [Streptococcus sp.]
MGVSCFIPEYVSMFVLKGNDKIVATNTPNIGKVSTNPNITPFFDILFSNITIPTIGNIIGTNGRPRPNILKKMYIGPFHKNRPIIVTT